MPNQHPGYLGYEGIGNEEFQTSVHCGDIAMHIEDLRLENDSLKSLLDSYNTTKNEQTLIETQKILYSMLQAKRRELCAFAIEQIAKNDAEGLEWRKILAPELEKTIMEFYNSITRTEILEIIANNDPIDEDFDEDSTEDLPNFTKLFEEKLNDPEYNFARIFQDPELGIAYIQDYYLQGNSVTADPLTAHMFKVPYPGSHGMMDFAAAMLQRQIIVINARNGEPYQSLDFSEHNRPPIFIGFDGALHYVELRPLTMEEMLAIVEQRETDTDKKIEQAIIRGKLYLINNPNDVATLELVKKATIKYAELNSKETSLINDKDKFIALANNKAKDKDLVARLYTTLFDMHINWINNNPQATSEQKEEQRILLINTLKAELKIDAADEATLRNLQQIIDIQATRTIGINKDAIDLATYIASLNNLPISKPRSDSTVTISQDSQSSDYQNVEVSSDSEASTTPPSFDISPRPTIKELPENPEILSAVVAPEHHNNLPQEQPNATNKTLWQSIKSFIGNIITALIYPFKWLIEVLTASATPVPASNTTNTTEKYFEIPSITHSSLENEISDLATRLQKYFVNNFNAGDSTTKQQLTVQWQDIMQTIKDKNYSEFCEKIENIMSQKNSVSRTSNKDLIWSRHLVEPETDPQIIIQLQANKLANKIKNQPSPSI